MMPTGQQPVPSIVVVLDKIQADRTFADSLDADFENMLDLKQALAKNGYPGFKDDDAQVIKRFLDYRLSGSKMISDLNVEYQSSTLKRARGTYKQVTYMSLAMFIVGLFLFLFAAVFGALTGNIVYTAAFGGLGATNFVAMFLLNPMDKSEAALSESHCRPIAIFRTKSSISFLAVGGRLTERPHQI